MAVCFCGLQGYEPLVYLRLLRMSGAMENWVCGWEDIVRLLLKPWPKGPAKQGGKSSSHLSGRSCPPLCPPPPHHPHHPHPSLLHSISNQLAVSFIPSISIKLDPRRVFVATSTPLSPLAHPPPFITTIRAILPLLYSPLF